MGSLRDYDCWWIIVRLLFISIVRNTEVLHFVLKLPLANRASNDFFIIMSLFLFLFSAFFIFFISFSLSLIVFTMMFVITCPFVSQTHFANFPTFIKIINGHSFFHIVYMSYLHLKTSIFF